MKFTIFPACLRYLDFDRPSASLCGTRASQIERIARLLSTFGEKIRSPGSHLFRAALGSFKAPSCDLSLILVSLRRWTTIQSTGNSGCLESLLELSAILNLARRVISTLEVSGKSQFTSLCCPLWYSSLDYFIP